MDRQALSALRHCYLCSGMTDEQILQFMDLAPGTIKLYEKGSLVFHILYRCEQSDGKISCLKGEIPFQEKLNIDGLQ